VDETFFKRFLAFVEGAHSPSSVIHVLARRGFSPASRHPSGYTLIRRKIQWRRLNAALVK
jgi:hypothetical protein